MGVETGTAATIAAYVGAASAVAGTAASLYASQQQARQAKMNAQAQANAQMQEAQRQQLEAAANQQRQALNQQRFRATQENMLAGGGFIGNTGSPLDIMTDTAATQSRELQDIGYGRDTNVWNLQAGANAAIGSGYSQASAIQNESYGTLLSNASQTAYQGYRVYKGNY